MAYKRPRRGFKIQESLYAVEIDWRLPGGEGERTTVFVRGRGSMYRAVCAVKQWAWEQGKPCVWVVGACLVTHEQVYGESAKPA